MLVVLVPGITSITHGVCSKRGSQGESAEVFIVSCVEARLYETPLLASAMTYQVLLLPRREELFL